MSGMILGIESKDKTKHFYRGKNMPVIYYRPNDNEASKRLQAVIENEASGKEIESYQSIDEFSKRLRLPNREKSIAVLFISSIVEIYQISSIRKFSDNISFILVLPDRSADIISAGYKLHPRFMSYADGDFRDVGVVLKKMIKLADNNKTFH